MIIEHKDRGWKITDGEEITYFGEYGLENANEGVIYKDYEAFKTGKGVCYIPEYGFENSEENRSELFEFWAKENNAGELIGNHYFSKEGYTRQDLINLVGEDRVEDLFCECDWAYPETIIDQWEDCE